MSWAEVSVPSADLFSTAATTLRNIDKWTHVATSEVVDTKGGRRYLVPRCIRYTAIHPQWKRTHWWPCKRETDRMGSDLKVSFLSAFPFSHSSLKWRRVCCPLLVFSYSPIQQKKWLLWLWRWWHLTVPPTANDDHYGHNWWVRHLTGPPVPSSVSRGAQTVRSSHPHPNNKLWWL